MQIQTLEVGGNCKQGRLMVNMYGWYWEWKIRWPLDIRGIGGDGKEFAEANRERAMTVLSSSLSIAAQMISTFIWKGKEEHLQPCFSVFSRVALKVRYLNFVQLQVQ